MTVDKSDLSLDSLVWRADVDLLKQKKEKRY
jgi:hypothetical protein